MLVGGFGVFLWLSRQLKSNLRKILSKSHNPLNINSGQYDSDNIFFPIVVSLNPIGRLEGSTFKQDVILLVK